MPDDESEEGLMGHEGMGRNRNVMQKKCTNTNGQLDAYLSHDQSVVINDGV